MPRNVRIPSYCHHKASGQAVVRIDGRDIYLGRHNTPESRQEYDRLIAEWLTRRNSPQPIEASVVPADFSVAELLARYLRFARTYYLKNGRPTRELVNLEHAMTPLANLYGNTAVRDFRPSRLKTVREAMIQANLARRTINARINRLRRIFKWGVENELVSAEVFHALLTVSPLKRGRSQARETDAVKPVAEHHVRAVMTAVPPTLAAMIELQWLTGMRPGELVIMRSCDIDTTGSVWFYRPAEHKTEHFGIERIVPLGPQAQQLLRPRLKVDVAAYIFSPKDVMAERYAARPTHRRKPNLRRRTGRKLQDRYTTPSYGRAIAYACQKAGIPHWSPNQLRHAAATRIRKEHGLDVAQVVLGHKTAEITQIYAEVDRVRAMEVMRQSG